METLSEEEYREKSKVFYTSTLNTWYSIRLEKDKQLLTLSITAIGFLVTLARTSGILSNLLKFFFSFALICFLLTVVLVLYSYNENADYLKKLLLSESTEFQECWIDLLERFANYIFMLAIFFVILIGLKYTLWNG